MSSAYRKKITVRFLKSTGTYAVFEGSKSHGSNFVTDKEATAAALKKFPGREVFVGGFGSPAGS